MPPSRCSATTATASIGLGGCDIPIDLVITGGELQVQFDDDAAYAGFTAVTLNLEDVPETVCDLGLLGQPKISISNFFINNDGELGHVGTAHNPADHDAGTATGELDGNHMIRSGGDLTVADAPAGNGDSELDLAGTLPVGTLNVTESGGDITVVFANDNYVMVDEDLDGGINFKLTGLQGTVHFAP